MLVKERQIEHRGVSASASPRKVCLLLTATVDVRGVNCLRSDLLDRLNDYRWALGRWVNRRDVDALVMVENSGYDLTSLEEVGISGLLSEDRVEFLSFDGQSFPRHLGKGYGENLNVRHAMDHSRILAEDSYVVARVNGRNYVENFDAFMNVLRGPCDVLCDLKQSLTWADGRVLGGTTAFYRDYACVYGAEVDDSRGYYYEHALARAVHHAMADGLQWRPFPEPPAVLGFSGSSNKQHDESRVGRAVRSAQHRLRLRMLDM